MTFRSVLLLFFALIALSPNRNLRIDQNKRLPNISKTPLINAYLTGNKTGLSIPLKKAHQNLNLQHLMTPSGLHLASLLLVFSFLIKGSTFQFIFLTLIFSLALPFDGIDSFKRMVIFGILRKNPLFPQSLKTSYLLTFLVTFLFGQYFENPLSFSLSFVFIGALIFSRNRIYTFILLALLQVVLANWFNRSFSLLGILMGLKISLISPVIFPLFLLESLFPSLPFSGLWSKVILFIDDLVFPSWRFSVIPLIPFIFFLPNKHLRRKALILSMLFLTLPLGHKRRKNSFTSPPPRGYTNKSSVKNGTKFIYENGMRCFSRLKADEWSHHCYK